MLRLQRHTSRRGTSTLIVTLRLAGRVGYDETVSPAPLRPAAVLQATCRAARHLWHTRHLSR